MSRQEVNPASNVIRAFRAPHNASRGGVDFVSASSQCRRSSPVRCVCRSISPGSSVPLENLGLVALERGDLATARRHFERAVAIDPGSSRAYAGLGNVALREGDRRSAIDAWRRAVQLDPRNFDALYNLSTTLARDGGIDA